MLEVSAMSLYYWKCLSMPSIPIFNYRRVRIQRKQLQLWGSSVEHSCKWRVMLWSLGVLPSPNTHTARAEERNSSSYDNQIPAGHGERHPLNKEWILLFPPRCGVIHRWTVWISRSLARAEAWMYSITMCNFKCNVIVWCFKFLRKK